MIPGKADAQSSFQSGMSGPCVRGEVATGRRGSSERTNEGQRTLAGLITSSEAKLLAVGATASGKKEFWFFKPVEDSADGWGNAGPKHLDVPRHSFCLQSLSLQLDQPERELGFLQQRLCKLASRGIPRSRAGQNPF